MSASSITSEGPVAPSSSRSSRGEPAAVGISGYGVAIPRQRITREEYVKAWGSFAAADVVEKSVLGYDEDIVTLATKAARRALETSGLSPSQVTRFALASTTPPYGEKLLSSSLVTGVGLPNDVFVSDHTTSTRAGTEALLACAEHLAGNPDGQALVAVADAPAASLLDLLEHGFGAGAAAFVLSTKNPIAALEGHASHVAEHFGERFRAPDEDRLHDLGIRRFSEESYLVSTAGAAGTLFTKLHRKPTDIAHAVLQQPDARVPLLAAARIGLSKQQLVAGLVSVYLGDLGAASTLVGLSAALDVAKRNETILAISYGSGAGSDALVLRVAGDRRPSVSVRAEAARKDYVDYLRYAKLRRALR
jgi:hydroxymethylglutaryl-CoA synthase